MVESIEVELDPVSVPFDLEYTLSCGQTFGWKKKDGSWLGVLDRSALKVTQQGDRLDVEAYPSLPKASTLLGYFGLDHDMNSIYEAIGRDALMMEALKGFRGLRLVRQEPWECLASFICATNASVFQIGGMVSNLRRRFGESMGHYKLHTFPTPQILAEASLTDLELCGLGFRGRLLKASAEAVASGRVSFESLLKMSYSEARYGLLSRVEKKKKLLPGVGPKVADCFLLFSLGKMEAFPIDVQIMKVVAERYSSLLGQELTGRLKGALARGEPPGLRDYGKVSSVMRAYFGGYAGYAQEYLYAYARLKPRP